MVLRFVVSEKDEDSGKRQGVFQALSEIRYGGQLYAYEEDRAREILEWFSMNLEKPYSFSRSSKPHPLNKAISWFKDTAKDHISKMRELISILENHGVQVLTIQTERPGYIVYEDDYQITAEPFTDTGA